MKLMKKETPLIKNIWAKVFFKNNKIDKYENIKKIKIIMFIIKKKLIILIQLDGTKQKKKKFGSKWYTGSFNGS